jgi:hypothetical protein
VNIFATSECPVQSAKEHCNVHNVKMILEICQLLSTAHFVLDGEQVGYKPTHQNHPSAVWVRKCSENYAWAYNHFKALCDEYTHRTGKTHKSSEMLGVLKDKPCKIVLGSRTPFAMAMPDEYKRLGVFDQTKAYQAYLNNKFSEWACRDKPMKIEWANRKSPDWLNI